MMNRLSLSEVSFRYAGSKKQILDNINLNIKKNTIHLILGESGSGKSTLINTIAGIIPQHTEGTFAGKIINDDNDITTTGIQFRAESIGIVFQDPDCQFCTYTVEDELAFAMENLRYSREAMIKRIDELLSIFKIEKLKYKPLNMLSGGEKQKVAMAGVMALDPEIIIFDEPTANLDPKSTSDTFKLIRMLKEEYSKTIIIVEHKLDELYEIIDEVSIISNEGKCIFSGTADVSLNFLLNNPDSVKVHVPKAVEFYQEQAYSGKLSDITDEGVARFIAEGRDLTQGFVVPMPKKGTFNEPMLEAYEINYFNKDYHILKGINLTVNKGDCIAVLGHNGSGKSTLLNVLMNLYTDYKGTVKLKGKNIKSYKRQNLWQTAGISFQNPEWQFLAHSVEEEILYSLKKIRISPDEKAELLDNCLEMFGLKQIRKQNPFLLSQGQKRRLSVASILAAGQEIIVLDEPTFGQDLKNQRYMMDKIRELNEKGVTVLIVTHDMDLVWEYCNRCIVLASGEKIYDSSVESLFENKEVLAKAGLSTPFWYRIGKLLERETSYEMAEVRNG